MTSMHGSYIFHHIGLFDEISRVHCFLLQSFDSDLSINVRVTDKSHTTTIRSNNNGQHVTLRLNLVQVPSNTSP